MEKKKYEFETLAIRTQNEQTKNREHTTPLYLSSSFTFENTEQGSAIFANQEEGFLYSRFSNPNTSEFINKLCKLEHCETGIATASGMAAIYTCFAALLKQGDHILASRDIFGNALYIITNILPKMGIEYTLVDVDRRQDWISGIKRNTKLIYLETPSNPTLKIADLKHLGDLCKKHEIISVVDNCFATPYLQNPADYDIDIILHSATKYIDGQGRVLGGAILGKSEPIAQCYDFLRRTGASLSPFNAWILSKSLETLALRMDRHCSNALSIAQWLEEKNGIEQVSYPLLRSNPQYELAKKQMKLGGGLIAFNVKGSESKTREFINRLKIFSLTANLGDSRSIATHPASTTHSKLNTQEKKAAGIGLNFVRLSIGLENKNDLIQDLDQALKNIK